MSNAIQPIVKNSFFRISIVTTFASGGRFRCRFRAWCLTKAMRRPGSSIALTSMPTILLFNEPNLLLLLLESNSQKKFHRPSNIRFSSNWTICSSSIKSQFWLFHGTASTRHTHLKISKDLSSLVCWDFSKYSTHMTAMIEGFKNKNFVWRRSSVWNWKKKNEEASYF